MELRCIQTMGKVPICFSICILERIVFIPNFWKFSNRTMYWTQYSHYYTMKSSIMEANLDGTNRRWIAAAADSGGIAIDYSSSRIIWADYYTLESSDLDGERSEGSVACPLVHVHGESLSTTGSSSGVTGWLIRFKAARKIAEISKQFTQEP